MARIIIIDDDENVLSMLGLALKAAGHTVALAKDGNEGIEKHRAAPADLIIIDLYMPGKEGLETIRELRRDFPGIKIIAMSGKEAASTMLAIALRLGAAKILTKPFDSEVLFKVIEEVL